MECAQHDYTSFKKKSMKHIWNVPCQPKFLAEFWLSEKTVYFCIKTHTIVLLFIYDTFVHKIFIFTHNKFFRFWLNSQIWLFCELWGEELPPKLHHCVENMMIFYLVEYALKIFPDCQILWKAKIHHFSIIFLKSLTWTRLP